MITWPTLPYEIIGKVVTVVVGVVLSVLISSLLIIGVLYVWVRVAPRIVNFLWRGYDIGEGEAPPRWRREISYYVKASSLLDMSYASKYRRAVNKEIEKYE